MCLVLWRRLTSRGGGADPVVFMQKRCFFLLFFSQVASIVLIYGGHEGTPRVGFDTRTPLRNIFAGLGRNLLFSRPRSATNRRLVPAVGRLLWFVVQCRRCRIFVVRRSPFVVGRSFAVPLSSVRASPVTAVGLDTGRGNRMAPCSVSRVLRPGPIVLLGPCNFKRVPTNASC